METLKDLVWRLSDTPSYLTFYADDGLRKEIHTEEFFPSDLVGELGNLVIDSYLPMVDFEGYIYLGVHVRKDFFYDQNDIWTSCDVGKWWNSMSWQERKTLELGTFDEYYNQCFGRENLI